MHARGSSVSALAIALVSLVGCGSDEGPPTANTVGTARADAGEAVPEGPPAQAAVALNKTSVSGCFNIATGALSEPPGTENYIAIINANVPPPDDIRVVDGESGAEVTCRVSGDSFTGRLVTSRLMFDVNGTVSGGTGTATISEWDTTSQETLTGNDCALNVKSFGPGAAWSQFNCAEFSSDPTIVCSVEGAFVFENCAE